MIEIIPAWLAALSPEAKKRVLHLQNHRAVALLKYTNGRISEAVARRIVAKCNRKIEQISKGAAV